LKGTPGTTAALGDDDDSDQVSEQTDSAEEASGLQKIAAALHNDESEIQAQCEFRMMYKGPAPPSLKEFFNHHWARIRDASTRYGSTSVPGSLLWTIQPFTEETLNISVYKLGMGLKVRFQPKAQKDLAMEKWPTVYTVDLDDGLSIAFPGVPRLPDAILMQYMVNLTVPWNGHEYGAPWRIYLTQLPWRKSETGENALQRLSEYPADMNPEAFNPRVPFNAAQPRDFSEIQDRQEISRILKFARDNE
jgi:hypothetical protein